VIREKGKKVEVEVLELGWNLRDLHFYLNKALGCNLPEHTFRRYRAACGLLRKSSYDKFDLAKLTVFAQAMRKFGSYEEAQKQLVRSLQRDTKFWDKVRSSN